MAANDPFDDYNPNLGDPGNDVYPITPSDSTDLPIAVRGLRANTPGTITVTTRAGNTRLMNFAAGETRILRVTRVWATGTTATGIEGQV